MESADQGSFLELQPGEQVTIALSQASWPDQERFPTNHGKSKVQDPVWSDLVNTRKPLVVAGYSSIAKIISLTKDWRSKDHDDGHIRVVLGTEPFATNQHHFRDERTEFSEETLRYWLEEQGISLRLSSRILKTIEAIDEGLLSTRFVHGRKRLHAKIFIGDKSATLGSSNLTTFGLEAQYEANVRFTRKEDQGRFQETAQIAENYWTAGTSWDVELRHLLEQLLQVVSWEEALARSCIDLLEGEWAAGYLKTLFVENKPLWPSQRSGIAEALWVTENVGSVLIADATGSGKTRMGAHLVRAARDRLWRTGRVRGDLTVLVGPPAVTPTWEAEAIGIGLMLSHVSHGKLSRSSSDRSSREWSLVRDAQILAVDEAHNFLNSTSKRTRLVRESLADHVMLFTATPISKGSDDLLDLVGLLGPDNFEDATLSILNRLHGRAGIAGGAIDESEIKALRREIQRFTVRRTKSQINAMVERDPEPYRHSVTNRISRYPKNRSNIYPTGETQQDEVLARQIRELVDQLRGIAQLEQEIAVPQGLRSRYSDSEWLQFRMRSAKGLAKHHVLEALRSSRAAAMEHLVGTNEAALRFSINPSFKPNGTGDVTGKVAERSKTMPDTTQLDCGIEPWLTNPVMWEAACRSEQTLYERIVELVDNISDAREKTKINLLTQLTSSHERVLAFDRHPITLMVLHSMFDKASLGEVEVIVAISGSQKKAVTKKLAPGAAFKAIALCSDAMSEGLNLQGASCIVHLDLPTTLRVAEQRVGRVERMDSPYDAIESWWPNDGQEFATRAYETLVRRARESEELLGSNLDVPDFEHRVGDVSIVTVEQQIQEAASNEESSWDGIQDALEPVRQLARGADALFSSDIYDFYRKSTSRVLSRVAPLHSHREWGFFSVKATASGAPRWILVDSSLTRGFTTDLQEIAIQLRIHLSDNPNSQSFGDDVDDALDRMLTKAAIAERELLPRRMRRALEQMHVIVSAWAARARSMSDEGLGAKWSALADLAAPGPPRVEPRLVAESWLDVIAPFMERHRSETRHSRYILLSDITNGLSSETLNYEEVVSNFTGLPEATPLEERVTACILGVPERA